MKRLKALGCLLAVVSSGCAELSQLLGSAFQKPSLSFQNLRLDGLSLEGLKLTTVWELENPNSIGLKVDSLDYRLEFDGKQVLAGRPREGLSIAARGKSALEFPAEIRFAELAPALLDFLRKNQASYRVSGSVGLKTPLGLLQLPLAKEGTLALPKLPRLSLQNPVVSKLSLTGVQLNFPMQVSNDNGFPLSLGALLGEMKIAGRPVGSLRSENLGALDAQGVRVLNLPVQIHFLQAGMAVAQAVQRGSADIQFDAQLQSGAVAVPLSVAQPVTFQK